MKIKLEMIIVKKKKNWKSKNFFLNYTHTLVLKKDDFLKKF